MSVFMKDKLSNFLLNNTLACLLDAMMGKYTQIDLRNETSVFGKIDMVDGYMNVELTNCKYQDARGNVYPFDTFFTKARCIRYVHIPDDISPAEFMEEHMKNKYKRPREKKKPTLKSKRSKQYQKETVEALQNVEKKSDG